MVTLMNVIRIRGARTHNLKNIDLDLPRDKLIVITGLSGSGKSSLAFDTLYAEGQRRYVESLSAYARQFLSVMEKPDVDLIEGLSPAISIEQKTTSFNPRSTVGTITEIYDYLRLLFARAGQPHCPEHGNLLEAQSVSQMADITMNLKDGSKIMILSPLVRERKGEYIQLIENLRKQGFIRARVDGEITELDNAPKLSLHTKHTIEVIIDRIKINPNNKQRLTESLETALNLSDGLASISFMDSSEDITFSSKFACPICGYSLTELEPRLFSFNNPKGACPTCLGLGIKTDFDVKKVIFDNELSLPQGAIRGWDRRSLFYFSMLISLGAHYEVDINIPFKDLPKDFQNIVLYGSNEKIKFTYVNNEHRWERTHTFEGVIPNLQRRYKETESKNVREELSKYLSEEVCDDCEGKRLNLSARSVLINKKNIADITSLTIEDALSFFNSLKLTGSRGKIAEKILKEICARLKFLTNVGLNYLTLARTADTLSGGESQRIRLASQIGSGLVGVMYILDEPTIGLHQADNERLLKTLIYLKDIGNTVIVVEHDEDTIKASDYIVDIGPGAGVHGGNIIAKGSLDDILKNEKSLTGRYLSGKISIDVPKKRNPFNKKQVLSLRKANKNNLKNVNVDIPIGLLTCVTGVSGSGKSSLINDTLYPQVEKGIVKSHSILKVIDINQKPIGRTPRSNPATYTGLFSFIREVFASTQEARIRGYKLGRFSFNVKGGRCEACQGDGVIKVEMHFLSDMHVTCDVCKGKKV